ncbi:unnamed protein product [Durusdinium trenchii]|uniref:Dystroglycan-type cadherin-like domain-containing protein n=1 Tax=Durusdinium trenchii TaxID=1381693 RepID=A0ABP0R1I8_9DINO
MEMLNTLSASMDNDALPSWLTFQSQSFTGVPPEVGHFWISLRDSEGRLVLTFLLHVVRETSPTAASQARPSIGVGPPQAPLIAQLIPDQYAQVAAPFALQLARNVVVNPSGGPVSLTATMLDVSPLPNWLTFDPAQQRFTGTPSDETELRISLVGTSHDGLSASTGFLLKVGSGGSSPFVTGLLPDITVLGGQALTQAIPRTVISDPDGDFLTFTLSDATGGALPSWLEFNPQSMLLSGAAPQTDQEVHLLVTGSDKDGHSASTPLRIHVKQDDTSGSNVQTDREGGAGSGTGDETGENGAAADGGAGSGAAGGEGPGAGAGGGLGTFSESLQIQALSKTASAAPLLTQLIPDQYAKVESPFELQLAQNVIAHPSGGPVSLHATMLDGSPLPSWLHFDPAQQLFTGDGTAAAGTAPHATELRISVVGTELNSGQSASTDFLLKVGSGGSSPFVTGLLPDVTVPVGQRLADAIPRTVITDPDGDFLTFTVTDGKSGSDLGLPSWLTFDPMSMLLSGAAPQKEQDVHLLVTGKDSDGHFASTPLQIHVTDTSHGAGTGAGSASGDETGTGGPAAGNGGGGHGAGAGAGSGSGDETGTGGLGAGNGAGGHGAGAGAGSGSGDETGTGGLGAGNGGGGHGAGAGAGSGSGDETGTGGLGAGNGAGGHGAGAGAGSGSGDETGTGGLGAGNGGGGHGAGAGAGSGSGDETGTGGLGAGNGAGGHGAGAGAGSGSTLQTNDEQGGSGELWTQPLPDQFAHVLEPFEFEVGTPIVRSPEMEGAPLVAQLIPDQLMEAPRPVEVPLHGTFVTPNGAPVAAASAHAPDGSPLPSWLHFDAEGERLTGTPPHDTELRVSVVGTGVDGLSAATSFLLKVGSGGSSPFVVGALSNVSVMSGQWLAESISRTGEGKLLTFKVSQSESDDSESLPRWLDFNAQSMLLSGSAPEKEQEVHLLVTGEVLFERGSDRDGNSASTPLHIHVKPPGAEARKGDCGTLPMSTEVSKPFVYFVPEKCIADPTGDSVHLSAAFVDGSPLPSWLTFDGSAFRGAFDANRFAGNGRKRRESKEGDPGARGAWARGRVARRKEERDHGTPTQDAQLRLAVTGTNRHGAAKTHFLLKASTGSVTELRRIRPHFSLPNSETCWFRVLVGSGGSAPFVAKPLPKLTLAAQQFFQQDPSSTSTTGRGPTLPSGKQDLPRWSILDPDGDRLSFDLEGWDERAEKELQLTLKATDSLELSASTPLHVSVEEHAAPAAAPEALDEESPQLIKHVSPVLSKTEVIWMKWLNWFRLSL